MDFGNSVQQGFNAFFAFLTNILGFLVILLIGFVIAKVVHAVTGLRVGAEAEEQGLDLRIHGERGYSM